MGGVGDHLWLAVELAWIDHLGDGDFDHRAVGASKAEIERAIDIADGAGDDGDVVRGGQVGCAGCLVDGLGDVVRDDGLSCAGVENSREGHAGWR